MSANKDVVSIKKYKKKDHFNVGIILFGVVFLYLIVTIILFLSEEKTAVYEVREGSILKDNSYTGIILRDETVYYAEKDGYINYFYESGKKVPFGRNVYILTSKEILNNTEEVNEEVMLNTENWNSLLVKVQSFNESFRNTEFQSAKALKEEFNSLLNSNTTQNRTTQLNSFLSSNEMPYDVYMSSDDGIIAYSIDGYESLELSDVSEKELSKNNYTKVSLVNNTKVKAGEPVYRLITEEDWTLVIKLSQNIEKQLKEQMGEKEKIYVKLRVIKDNKQIGGYMSIKYDREGAAYGYISLSDSVVRYAEDRYLDVELILENESGLKIPKSAVTQKEFYVLPENFLANGGASSATGVYKENAKENSIRFVEVNVFAKDVESGLVYVEKESLKDNDVIIESETQQRLTISDTVTIDGVYNVNKGYAVFKRISILSESEDYYIIEEGISNGLYNYDRIALDGDVITDYQIISQ